MKMNKRKLLLFTGLTFLAATNLFAGNNEKGIEYFDAELYEAAKIFFLQQDNLSPIDQAENYYYLGQVYYQLNQVDSASFYYQKATKTFPEYPFGYIGEGKLELKKGNKKIAEEFFKKANNFAKKNPAVQTAIAEVYLDADDYVNTVIALDKAKKVNNKYSGIYLVEGDMLMKKGKIGEACSSYDNAILFNNSDKVAYLKSAKVYTVINKNRALDYLEQLIAIDPYYIPAYAVIGDINREIGSYQKAIDAYEKFIAIQGVPITQHEYYAQLLFFQGYYDKASDYIKYVLSRDPNNLVMKRLQAYNNLRLENFSLGLEQINNFLEIMPEERHIYQDYITLAQLATKEKQIQLAIEGYQKAFDLDSERAIADKIQKEISKIALDARMYKEAVGYYEKYFETESSPEPLDYYNYGQAGYGAALYYIEKDNIAMVTTPEANADFEAALKNYVGKGDKAYAEVIKKRPDFYIGYLGRANINSLLDSNDDLRKRKFEGHAKPFFEEALGVMLANNADGLRNRDIINSYKYLLSYYSSPSAYDKPTIIEYCKKILDIDPNDEMARNALSLFKIKY